MKKMLILLLAFLCLSAAPCIAESEKDEPTDEWTILFYLCGSDLKSRNGYASAIFSDIVHSHTPSSTVVTEETLHRPDSGSFINPGRVNVLLQTGGSKKWHVQEHGLEQGIPSDRLCRISFDEFSEDGNQFRMEETLPLQSMADPGTLTEFIRWGIEARPAKKYALVLWGHGDGAKTGILHDELFDGDILRLDELRDALSDSGAVFEAVVLDACLMANLETAYAIHDCAKWMAASEEMVPGQGTAVDDWLQELFNQPEMEGKRLGRNICDMTLIQYANTDNDQAKDLITWSVIDLSRIERVYEAMRQISGSLYFAYTSDPQTMQQFAACLNHAEKYGQDQDAMLDAASVFYQMGAESLMDLYWRNEILEALADAVVYCVRGPGRSEARGLSFCFGVNFTDDELDSYARNCTMPHYLAFLDALSSSWTAPDWVYEIAQKLPEINTLDGYTITAEKRMTADGVPGLAFSSDDYRYLAVNYRLYQAQEDGKSLIRLGHTPCRSFQTDDGKIIWSAVEPWWWPAIDGELCDIEMVSAVDNHCLYSVPIQIGSEIWYLRYGREYEKNLKPAESSRKERYATRYTIYGLWAGYDNNSSLLTRNVQSLSQMAGQEYRLLYPLEQEKSTEPAEYATSGFQSLYRALRIDSALLPPGTYYLEYEVQDMFMRPILLERIQMDWDGEKLSFPDGFVWEGPVTLVSSK